MAIDSKKIPAIVKIFSASVAGICATLVSHPLEVLKLHMQVDGAGGMRRNHDTLAKTAVVIWNRAGVRGFYRALGASVYRQAQYSGVRLGLFQVLVDYFTPKDELPGTIVLTASSVVAGALGGFIGLPPDVALTRMALDRRRRMKKRHNYTNVFDAMKRIMLEEGVQKLYLGLGPTIARAITVNTSQMITYMLAKKFFLQRDLMKDDNTCHLVCSLLASIVATTAALPPDMAKIRLQHMKEVEGVPEYTGMLDVMMKVVRNEGPLALWKGYTPLLMRNVPQFIVLFIVYENLILQYKKTYFEASEVHHSHKTED